MTKFKLFAAAAALSVAVAAPAMAQEVHRDIHHHHRGPVGAAVGAAADVAGAAIGTAAAIATAPFRNSNAYYDDGKDYYARNMGPEGFACRPGAWSKGDDGRRHICQ
jgi:hypothetical protein